MLNRNLLAALVLGAASSVAFAAPASDAGATSADRPATQVVEGKAACTAEVEGTARQTAEIAACNLFRYPKGTY